MDSYFVFVDDYYGILRYLNNDWDAIDILVRCFYFARLIFDWFCDIISFYVFLALFKHINILIRFRRFA